MWSKCYWHTNSLLKFWTQVTVSLTDSTLRFLFEQWKDHFPPGYVLKDAFVDQPFEEDACRCHFAFVQDSTMITDQQLVLKYQWFVGERPLSNFVAIPDAIGEVTNSCRDTGNIKFSNR